MTAQKKTKEITPYQEVGATLDKMKSQFALVLPSTTTPEKFIRIVRTALQITPSLLDCDRNTLYAACMRAAQDGLLPDGREGAIVQFGKTAQWMPMIGGLCKKARNSGEIESIDAVVVKENDEFSYWYDEKGAHFLHRPKKSDRGNDVLTYAFALTKQGFFFEPVDEQQMVEIEKVSRAKNGPWKGPFRGEMKRKSALRRLCKYRLPSSTDVEDVLNREDEQYDVTESVDAPAEQAPTKSSRLAGLISADEGAELDRPWNEETDGPRPESAT